PVGGRGDRRRDHPPPTGADDRAGGVARLRTDGARHGPWRGGAAPARHRRHRRPPVVDGAHAAGAAGAVPMGAPVRPDDVGCRGALTRPGRYRVAGRSTATAMASRYVASTRSPLWTYFSRAGSFTLTVSFSVLGSSRVAVCARRSTPTTFA